MKLLFKIIIVPKILEWETESREATDGAPNLQALMLRVLEALAIKVGIVLKTCHSKPYHK